jgi:hypothetical protein
VIESERDIFGKIDAILEKRDREVLAERPISHDDFPTLTEVIDIEIISSQADADRAARVQANDWSRSEERRVGQRRIAHVDSDLNNPVITRAFELFSEDIERRLSELLINEHRRTEERLVNLIVNLLNERTWSKK